MNPVNTRTNQLPRSQFLLSSKNSSSTSGAMNTATSSALSSATNGSVLHTLGSQSREQAMFKSSEDDKPYSANDAAVSSEGGSSHPGVAAMADAAVNSAIAADTAGLEAAKSAMQNNLGELASNPEKFHAAMQKSFGESYDKVQAEQIRGQVLEGDFSWMPDIKVVDESVLTDQSGQQGGATGLGAYSKDNDTIYISRQLLASDPDKATQILTEEVGHGLDARLNTSDAAGDEGDIFSRLVGGEEISDTQLAELKSENDSGTIIVDGKEVEVEYGLGIGRAFKKAAKKIGKAVSKPFKAVRDGIKDFGESVVKGVKKLGKKILESKLIGTLMTVAQFIPIPVVQVIARGYNLIKSGYMLAKGIQHGSIGMVLSGAAGVAGGIGSMGKAFGASQGFVNGANKIASGLSKAGTAYKVASEKDFGAAAQLASNYFGGPDTSTGRAFQTASHVINAGEKLQDGDYMGAIQSGRAAYKGFSDAGDQSSDKTSDGNTGSAADGGSSTAETGGFQGLIDSVTGSKVYTAITENVSTFREIVKVVKEDGLSAGSQMFLANYGEDLGINADTQQSIVKWAGVLDKVKVAADMVNDKDYSNAIGQAADMLDIPLTDKNQQRLDTVFRLRDSVLGDKYADASRQAAVLSLQTGNPRLASNFMQLANLLEGKLPTVQLEAA